MVFAQYPIFAFAFKVPGLNLVLSDKTCHLQKIAVLEREILVYWNKNTQLALDIHR